ncbi:MAG: hypothetical protein IT529_08110 [Burkholderiales bacterium]|nr:hypothetical protein [Burkholderiales bacterium]
MYRFALVPLLLLLPACAAGQQDKLVINGVSPGSTVVVMMDARTDATASGCRNDLILISAGETSLGNLREPKGCNSEIAIFSRDHAMVLTANKDWWTDKPGDTVTVDLLPRIRVPVSVWVQDDNARLWATMHMTVVETLYRENRVGVEFVASIRNLSEVTTDPRAGQIIENGIVPVAGGHACRNLEEIQKQPFYTPRTLNVYYVNQLIGGRNCAILESAPNCQSAGSFLRGDGNITFVSGLGSSSHTVLAHEFGHAFGLRPAACGGHVDVFPERFGPDNIMWKEGGLERTRLTLGQVFRMHTHRDQWGGTMLIENGLRPGPGRTCPPHLEGYTCPGLDLDWP